MVLKRTMNVSSACGEKDSIDHTFLHCRFANIFVNNVIDWFNAANNSKFLQQLKINYLISYLAHTKKKYLRHVITRSHL